MGASWAEFSPCRRWRYTLGRTWSPGQYMVAFIGLNPSTADESADDPTIRRCVSFARDWGFGGLIMLNIFAWRATDPRELKTAEDPIGPGNDDAIHRWTCRVPRSVAAWGVHGAYLGRGAAVARLVPTLYCLGVTRAGWPRHPLYLRRDTEIVPFTRLNQPVEWE